MKKTICDRCAREVPIDARVHDMKLYFPGKTPPELRVDICDLCHEELSLRQAIVIDAWWAKRLPSPHTETAPVDPATCRHCWVVGVADNLRCCKCDKKTTVAELDAAKRG